MRGLLRMLTDRFRRPTALPETGPVIRRRGEITTSPAEREAHAARVARAQAELKALKLAAGIANGNGEKR
jgi:hypothetical protein